jgi:glucose uptake protein GlcU
MATILKIKRSEVASNVPGAGDLAIGELAMNATDKKIYTKLANGTVVEIANFVDLTSKEDTGVATAMSIALG